MRPILLLAILSLPAAALAQPQERSIHGGGGAQLCLHNAAPVVARLTVTSSSSGRTTYHTPDTVLLGQTRCTQLAAGASATVLVEAMDATLRFGEACRRQVAPGSGEVTITLRGNAVSGVQCS